MDKAWQPVHPRQAARWLSPATVRWWFAGGWALDLFLGTQSRPHGDLDVGVSRRDALALIATLSSWEFFEAKDGVLTRLPAGSAPRENVNSLWSRPWGTAAWQLEVMLDACAGDRWIYRRHSDVTMPLSMAIRRSTDDLPYLAPEIQLLYKARNARPRDHADFVRVLPALSADARIWLRDALARTDSGHEWINILDSLS
jgi:aminoglycoside-2''-adenylyltransferase